MKLAGLMAIPTIYPSIATAQQLNAAPRKYVDVRFTDGVHSFALPDGSWNLWVRCAPKKADTRIVRLRLQVAEDDSFNRLISEQVHVTTRDTAFILRTNYSSKNSVSDLFYRFVAVDSGLPESPNLVVVSEVGRLAYS